MVPPPSRGRVLSNKAVVKEAIKELCKDGKAVEAMDYLDRSSSRDPRNHGLVRDTFM